MELNKKTIKTIINALQIAKEVTQISYSDNQLKCRLSSPGSSNDPFFLENQSNMICSIDEYEKLIDDFRELNSRQDYPTSDE
jgi:hypothetical protein